MVRINIITAKITDSAIYGIGKKFEV